MTEINFIEGPYREYSNDYDMPINRQISLTPEQRLVAQILQSFETDSDDEIDSSSFESRSDDGIDSEDDDEQNIQNAFQLLDQGISANPSYPGYYLLKGKMQVTLHELQNGIANLSKAIEMEPYFSDPYFVIGEAQYFRSLAYIRQHRLKDAYADLKSAVLLGNEDAKKLFESYFSDEDQWIFGSKSVLDQFPVSLEGINNSTSYLFSKALELFTRSIKAVETEEASWTNPKILQRNCEAIAYLKEAISLDSNQPSFYILLGKLYINIFERDLAIESLSKAIEIDPNFSDSNFPPGEALFQMGRANYCEFNKMIAQQNFKAAIEQFNHEEAKIWLEMTDSLR
ncbi:MAG TPA: hypothetical protein VLE96_05685 [Chlamydiales bacterium]|nr:hypothetical protein [Chlamydiales bacterium]